MSRKKLPLLLAVLTFKISSSLAQSSFDPVRASAPDPDYQQVSVPVPRAVSLITDVAKVLFSHEEEVKDKVQALVEKRRQRSERSDQSINITIPKNRLTRTLGLVD